MRLPIPTRGAALVAGAALTAAVAAALVFSSLGGGPAAGPPPAPPLRHPAPASPRSPRRWFPARSTSTARGGRTS